MGNLLFLIISVLFSTLLYWIYWRYTHRKLLALGNVVPGPPALPIIGNALLFIGQSEEQLNKISSLLKKYGQYVRVWLGPELNICVKNPTDVRFLLTSNKVNKKGPLYNFMATFIGNGILTGGPFWRMYRKIATPTYSKKSVQMFSEVFNREADELGFIIRNKNLDTFDVYRDVVYITTQCVCQTLLGLSKEESQNLKCLNEIMWETQSVYGLIFSKMTKWWLHLPFVYWFTEYRKQEKYYIKIINEMTTDILDKRRKALNGTLKVDEERMGVVDRFILDGLSDTEVKLETFTLFTTSQEAAAKITSGLLVFLAHLPEWQEKVYKEVIQIVGCDADVTEEHLKQLHNLDLVFKEVLRWLSIAAFIQRTVEEEITINNGKITVVAGTSLIIPIHEIHRDPIYWEEPLKIKPERFLPENMKNRDSNAFVPFSLGAMDCLGRVYAASLIKTLVVKVIREVHLEADGNIEDLDLHVAISVKFSKGYNLRARPRTKL